MSKVKFPLEMANGVQVRTIEELKDNFDINKVVGYFLEGKLQTWLTDRYYDEEAEQIAELRSDDPELAKKISEIFEIEYVEVEEVDVDKIASDNERIAKIKQFTDDEDIIKNYDKVAFTQEELADLYDARVETIYLCEGEFKIPKAKLELNYIVFGGAKTNLPEKKQEEPKIELPKECVEIITKLEEIIKTTREPQIYSDSVSTYVEDDEDWEYNFKSEEEAKTALTAIIKKVFDDVNGTTEAVYGAMIENYINSSVTFNLEKLKKLYNCVHQSLKDKYNSEFDDETKKADIKAALQKLQDKMKQKGKFNAVTDKISSMKYSSSEAFSNLEFYVSLCDVEKFDNEFDDGEPDEYRYNSYNGISDIEKDANDYISLMENKITKTFDMEFEDVIYTEFVEIVKIISEIRWIKDTSKEKLGLWHAGLIGRVVGGSVLGAMSVVATPVENKDSIFNKGEIKFGTPVKSEEIPSSFKFGTPVGKTSESINDILKRGSERFGNFMRTGSPLSAEEIEDIANKGKEYYSTENYSEAVKCFKEASDNGHSASSRNLGICYTFGYGVAKNMDEAKYYLRLAIEQGDTTAVTLLDSDTYR